jgi:hypothetical protein
MLMMKKIYRLADLPSSNSAFAALTHRSRIWIAVVMLHIRFGSSYQFGNRVKDPTSNSLIGQIAKLTLNHVEIDRSSR